MIKFWWRYGSGSVSGHWWDVPWQRYALSQCVGDAGDEDKELGEPFSLEDVFQLTPRKFSAQWLPGTSTPHHRCRIASIISVDFSSLSTFNKSVHHVVFSHYLKYDTMKYIYTHLKADG